MAKQRDGEFHRTFPVKARLTTGEFWPQCDATGRIAKCDYSMPVNADIGYLGVVFVGEPDGFNALGIKAVGEIGTIGVAAASANAVFHATGRRIRSLPIKIEHILSCPRLMRPGAFEIRVYSAQSF